MEILDLGCDGTLGALCNRDRIAKLASSARATRASNKDGKIMAPGLETGYFPRECNTGGSC